MYANGILQDKVESDNFEIIRSKNKIIKKFNTETSTYNIVFKNIPTQFIDSIVYMKKIMMTIVQNLLDYTSNKDKIKITIDHPVLTEPIELPFVFSEDLTANMITSEIGKVIQSNKILTLDNNITFHALILRYLRGGGGKVKRLENFLFKKQTIVRIVPRKDNNLCALRAIVVGKAICDNDHNYSKIKDSRNQIQMHCIDHALILANELNLALDQEIGLHEIKRIEQHLKIYQIIVFNNEQMNEMMYVGKPQDKKIFLYYNDHHYDTIKSLSAFFGKKNFCFICMKAYETLVNHPCNNVCKKCRVLTCS